MLVNAHLIIELAIVSRDQFIDPASIGENGCVLGDLIKPQRIQKDRVSCRSQKDNSCDSSDLNNLPSEVVRIHCMCVRVQKMEGYGVI